MNHNKNETTQEEKISAGLQTQKFFKDKVFYGIDGQALRRKVYRGRRDKEGKRKNEVFYVDEEQDVRIEEALLIDCVRKILDNLIVMEEADVKGWDKQAAAQYFQIQEKRFMRTSFDMDDYKQFISSCIENRDCQTYENIRLRKLLKEGNFKDIIEKIEVYDTGIVCVFTNAFEMSIRF